MAVVGRSRPSNEWACRSRACEARAGTSSRAPGAPLLDFVFTVCDKAAGETCPVWPGQPITAHWGVQDPAAFEGPEEKKSELFRSTLLTLTRRIAEPSGVLSTD